MKFELTVNGKVCSVDTSPMRRLLDILARTWAAGRQGGVRRGECGMRRADGRLVNSCLIPAFQLPGRSVETIEALSWMVRPIHCNEPFLMPCGAVRFLPWFGHGIESASVEERTPYVKKREGIAGNLAAVPV